MEFDLDTWIKSEIRDVKTCDERLLVDRFAFVLTYLAILKLEGFQDEQRVTIEKRLRPHIDQRLRKELIFPAYTPPKESQVEAFRAKLY